MIGLSVYEILNETVSQYFSVCLFPGYVKFLC